MALAGRILSGKISAVLFGDRERFGLSPDETDQDWQTWQATYLDFYNSTQKAGFGRVVNDAGYRVMQDIKLEGLTVAEIGPGSLPHRDCWKGEPAKFIGIDVNQSFLDISESKAGCLFQGIKVAPDDTTVPLADESIDILLSYYSLEHLNPLGDYLDEYARLLKPGGLLVGAIPNEGGLFWGLGRFLTSRRWIHANTSLNYDKIICWEHPNFADTIIAELDKRFSRQTVNHYPKIGLSSQNLTLLTRFVYRKPN